MNKNILTELNKKNFDNDSLERVLMFIMSSRGCLYLDQLNEEDLMAVNNIKEVLINNSIKFEYKNINSRPAIALN